MTITAFSLYEAENLVPFAPHGASGVLKGSVAAFFGFLGFDEVIARSSPVFRSGGSRVGRHPPPSLACLRRAWLGRVSYGLFVPCLPSIPTPQKVIAVGTSDQNDVLTLL